MNGLILVALGGGIGAAGRYLLGKIMFRLMGPGFPWGTLVANVLGGLVMGLFIGWLTFKVSGGQNLRLFIGVGVLGGFTTFSSFSLESLRMIENKAYAMAAGYMSASVVLSILAVFIGLMMARKIFVI